MTGVAGVPDLLKLRGMAARQTEVKSQLMRAQQEAVTGQRADRVAATGGDTGRLMALDRVLAGIEARAPMLGLAATRADATQAALATLRDAPGGLGVSLADSASNASPTQRAVLATQADGALRQAMTALNTTLAGRALFGGAGGAGPAVAGADDLIAAVRAALASDPDITVALAAVDDVFSDDPASVFRTTIYRGSAEDAPPVDLGDERLSYAVRADDRAVRDLLKGLALAAALPGSAHGSSAEAVVTAFGAAASALREGDTGLILRQAQLGAAEARIDAAQTGDAAERTALGIARNGMIGKDEYDAATEVAELQNRLEVLYAITARTANLSFVNYLR
jgi:flagellar hook-associated protein 3 FlgL